MSTFARRTMGSVSSVINGSSLDTDHCKALEYQLKKEKNLHRRSGSRSLDGLLNCGFTQGSSSSTYASKGLAYSHSGQSEDFFYIKTTAEKSLARSTFFKPLHPQSTSSSKTGHSSLDRILCPLEKDRISDNKNKQDTFSGTLSDSGRNSMSSLPSHSNTGSLGASTGPVNHCDGSSAPTNSLSRTAQTSLPLWVKGSNINLDSSHRTVLNTAGLATKRNGEAGSPPSAQEPSPLSETAGGIRSPISPDESLIERLEQRLLERETELQELQVSFEEKEADACHLFEKRQTYFVEEMEGLKQRCSTKLRQVSQMAVKTQQALQLQEEKEKLQEDFSKLSLEKDLLQIRLRAYENDGTQLAPTLEETQWEVCQKTGEISLLKQQLRDSQADVNHKLNEIVSLRASLKENTAKMETLQKQNKDYEDKLHTRTIEAEVSQNELHRKKNEADFLREKVGKLERDIQEMKEDLAAAKEERSQHTRKCEANVPSQASERLIQRSNSPAMGQKEEENNKETSPESLHERVEKLKKQLEEEKDTQEKLASSFERERETWNKEKDRVIKYQKQLQINYLQMHRKNQDLERILKELTTELESRTELELPYSSGLQTYDDIIATEI
uniref:Leucine zipper tumor suppressor 1 n=1 Tax=Cynoglossus semilaevis TaxID=244447 RepID=A0A3P8WAW2_CYNSE